MELKETQYYLADINDILPYAKNSRTHSESQISQIAASIKEFGFLAPIVVSEDGTILCGHGRYYASQKLGLKKVPCIKEEYLTESQRRAYVIADNSISLNAGWNDEMLSVELSDLQADNFDLDLLGFDVAELDKLFNPESEIEEDDFDVNAELEQPTFSKTGDLWLLGNHRLICGDSTKQETYDILMDGKKANLCVTDPPYNVNYEGTAGKIKNDHMANEAFHSFLYDAFSCIEKALADDASIYVFHADTEGLNFRKAFQEAGFYLSGTCIWKKQSLVLGRSPYQWQHEPVLYGWKKKGKHQWYTGRKESTIWEFDKPRKNGDHPTMKPLPLLAYPIQNSSMSNCIVLDAFGGSGSTLIACEQTNRICHMIELDEKFVDVIVKRYIEQVGTSENVTLIRDGKTLKYEDVVTADEE